MAGMGMGEAFSGGGVVAGVESMDANSNRRRPAAQHEGIAIPSFSSASPSTPSVPSDESNTSMITVSPAVANRDKTPALII